MAISEFLEQLRVHHGVDLTPYRRSTVERSVHRRTAALAVADTAAYLERVRDDPHELAALIDAVLVTRTAFFRDARTMAFIAGTVLPDLLAAIPAGRPVRVWSAGCATGEEAYSLAMMLDAAMGREAYLERAEIHGTDLDDRALGVARDAIYPTTRVARVPQGLRDRCLVPEGRRWAVHPEVRSRVRFDRSDLISDPPPVPEVDLVACRNTLLYFGTQTRRQVLERLRAAMTAGGRLVLGNHEMLTDADGDWVAVTTRHRVYAAARRTARPSPGDAPAQPGDGRPTTAVLGRAAFETMPMPGLVVDAEMRLRLANRAARELFDLRTTDVGAPLGELWASRQPRDLPQRVDAVLRRPRPVTTGGIRLADRRGRTHTLRVQLQPMFDGDDVCAVAASLSSAGGAIGPETDAGPEDLRRQMAQMFEELQTTVEELEATNEELNRANEELSRGRRPTPVAGPDPPDRPDPLDR